jgi:hypothetical protein
MVSDEKRSRCVRNPVFFSFVKSSVPNPDPNPDPPDPRVFWPPGSGSTSQRYGSGSGTGSGSFYIKNNKKNLESYYFVTLFDFLS